MLEINLSPYQSLIRLSIMALSQDTGRHYALRFQSAHQLACTGIFLYDPLIFFTYSNHDNYINSEILKFLN